MTRAPTYPIHRNRRNSISIRFSVRSIRFSRCGLRPFGPRPPASLALGGKEIHYPPRGAESRASSRSTGPPQPGSRGGPCRGGASARWTTSEALEREKGKPKPHGAPCGTGRGRRPGPGRTRKARPCAGAGLGACLYAYMCICDRRSLNQLDELALTNLQRRPDQG